MPCTPGMHSKIRSAGAGLPGQSAYQDISSPEVKAFCTEAGRRGEFLPLAAVAGVLPVRRMLAHSQHDRDAGWSVRRDLAVGVAEGGSGNCGCDRELYCLKASVRGRRRVPWPAGAKLESAADGSAYHRRPRAL